jgi:hypothetical protein
MSKRSATTARLSNAKEEKSRVKNPTSNEQYIELRLTKFDAHMVQQGIVDVLPDFITKERKKIAHGRAGIRYHLSMSLSCLIVRDLRARARDKGIRLFGLTRKLDILNRIVDVEMQSFTNDVMDAELDAFLSSDSVKREADARATINAELDKFGHQNLRIDAALAWYHEIHHRSRWTADMQSPRELAKRTIAKCRAEAFSQLVGDVSIVAWDGSTVRSHVAANARQVLSNPAKLEKGDWQVKLNQTVAVAENQIAEWQVEQERLKTIHLERKAELERQLARLGFVVEPHHVLVRVDLTCLELDVRHELAVEFSGQDPPMPVGVSFRGEMFVVGRGRLEGIYSTRVRPIPGPVDTDAFRQFETAPLWRLRCVDFGTACLRWPLRLDEIDVGCLTRIVNKVNSAVHVPVQFEIRAARRGTLLRALRAHGIADTRIPLAVWLYNCRFVHAFLKKKEWPRSRALRSALVGDVASAQHGDIFASLPQIAIATICEHIDNDLTSLALVAASDAFALGAAIFEIERRPPKPVFEIESDLDETETEYESEYDSGFYDDSSGPYGLFDSLGSYSLEEEDYDYAYE